VDVMMVAKRATRSAKVHTFIHKRYDGLDELNVLFHFASPFPPPAPSASETGGLSISQKPLHAQRREGEHRQ
jgi:hypothetical protein